jgi:hypothetical protein
MTPAVVDTDVVSFLFKNDSRAQIYLPPELCAPAACGMRAEAY